MIDLTRLMPVRNLIRMPEGYQESREAFRFESLDTELHEATREAVKQINEAFEQDVLMAIHSLGVTLGEVLEGKRVRIETDASGRRVLIDGRTAITYTKEIRIDEDGKYSMMINTIRHYLIALPKQHY